MRRRRGRPRPRCASAAGSPLALRSHAYAVKENPLATETKRKFAVVTGASSGIGFELARQCLEHDFDVLICADDPKIEGAATLLGAAGGVVIPVQADLATYDGVERLYSAIVEQHRPVDALLLNAGIGLGGEFIRLGQALTPTRRRTASSERWARPSAMRGIRRDGRDAARADKVTSPRAIDPAGGDCGLTRPAGGPRVRAMTSIHVATRAGWCG